MPRPFVRTELLALTEHSMYPPSVRLLFAPQTPRTTRDLSMTLDIPDPSRFARCSADRRGARYASYLRG